MKRDTLKRIAGCKGITTEALVTCSVPARQHGALAVRAVVRRPTWLTPNRVTLLSLLCALPTFYFAQREYYICAALSILAHDGEGLSSLPAPAPSCRVAVSIVCLPRGHRGAAGKRSSHAA